MSAFGDRATARGGFTAAEARRSAIHPERRSADLRGDKPSIFRSPPITTATSEPISRYFVLQPASGTYRTATTERMIHSPHRHGAEQPINRRPRRIGSATRKLSIRCKLKGLGGLLPSLFSAG